MKNIYLLIFILIFILIFLYFICNEYIENFSVGCQSNGQGNDNKINISDSLTLSYIENCKGRFADDCNVDSDCESNNCHEFKCKRPKCKTSIDCDDGNICWGWGDTRICDINYICSDNPSTGTEHDKLFCDNDPTCDWNTTTNKCKTNIPGIRDDGLYDCVKGECKLALTNDNIHYHGNYKDLNECDKYCK